MGARKGALLFAEFDSRSEEGRTAHAPTQTSDNVERRDGAPVRRRLVEPVSSRRRSISGLETCVPSCAAVGSGT